MLSRLKSAVSGAVEGLEGPRSGSPKDPVLESPHKHRYSRPPFLNLTEVAISISRDKRVRPILSASSSSPLPYHTGYAECVNAGKSNYNEDMAQVYHGTLRCKISEFAEAVLPYAYYGIFDGHAGFGAALDASKQLHHILHQKLVNAMDTIFASLKEPPPENCIDRRTLITGCLEAAFVEMDEVIEETTRKDYQYPGGCTAIVALFILGEVFVANAGDCRAGICDNGKFVQISNDFSPHFDKARIYQKAFENPDLLGDRYNVREYYEPPTREDLGKMILYKEPCMSGWSFKTLSYEDLKMPLVTGVGRRSRIMGTIGVARGFGDFGLGSNHYRLPIKPLLSCIPEVKVFSQSELVTDTAVLVMGSDGLWDAVDTEDVADMCCDLNLNAMHDRNKYVSVAMNLVAAARGRKDMTTNMWCLKNSIPASLDDISVFVIPFQPYFYKRCEIVHTRLAKGIFAMEVSDSESRSQTPSTEVDEDIKDVELMEDEDLQPEDLSMHRVQLAETRHDLDQLAKESKERAEKKLLLENDASNDADNEDNDEDDPEPETDEEDRNNIVDDNAVNNVGNEVTIETQNDEDNDEVEAGVSAGSGEERNSGSSDRNEESDHDTTSDNRSEHGSEKERPGSHSAAGMKSE